MELADVLGLRISHADIDDNVLSLRFAEGFTVTVADRWRDLGNRWCFIEDAITDLEGQVFTGIEEVRSCRETARNGDALEQVDVEIRTEAGAIMVTWECELFAGCSGIELFIDVETDDD